MINIFFCRESGVRSRKIFPSAGTNLKPGTGTGTGEEFNFFTKEVLLFYKDLMEDSDKLDVATTKESTMFQVASRNDDVDLFSPPPSEPPPPPENDFSPMSSSSSSPPVVSDVVSSSPIDFSVPPPSELRDAMLKVQLCLPHFLTIPQIITALQTQFELPPSLTLRAYTQLKSNNESFFQAYETKLMLKDQVAMYNYLVGKHREKVDKRDGGG